MTSPNNRAEAYPGSKASTARTAALAVATLIGVSLGACTVSVGSGSGSYNSDAGLGIDAAPTTPPVATGNAACNSCLFQGCSGQHALCQQNGECIAIYECATKTGCDENCVRGCFDAHPNGQREYTALYQCDQQTECATCSAACNVASCAPPQPATSDAAAPANDSGVTTPDASAPGPVDCSSCTQSRCGAEQSACAPNSDCDAYSACVIACPDAACTATCGTAHPSGKTASDALAACTSQNCKAECGL